MSPSLFLILLLSSSSSAVALKDVRLIVVNKLKYTTNPMSVRCWSGNDDIGTSLVNTNAEYSFEFDVDIYKKTWFKCHVEPDAEYYAEFVAFQGYGTEYGVPNRRPKGPVVRPSKSGTTETYERYWEATDDGVFWYKNSTFVVRAPWVKNG